MKIAVVLLMALSLSGCFGAGLAGVVAGAIGNTMQGSSGQGQVYYVRPRPPSYTCYQNGPWVNCDPG
jgi:hypothetical protein